MMDFSEFFDKASNFWVDAFHVLNIGFDFRIVLLHVETNVDHCFGVSIENKSIELIWIDKTERKNYPNWNMYTAITNKRWLCKIGYLATLQAWNISGVVKFEANNRHLLELLIYCFNLKKSLAEVNVLHMVRLFFKWGKLLWVIS